MLGFFNTIPHLWNRSPHTPEPLLGPFLWGALLWLFPEWEDIFFHDQALVLELKLYAPEKTVLAMAADEFCTIALVFKLPFTYTVCPPPRTPSQLKSMSLRLISGLDKSQITTVLNWMRR